jgi:hypothetical protein
MSIIIVYLKELVVIEELTKSHINNTILQIFFIYSPSILLTFLAVFIVNVAFAEEIVTPISGGSLPVPALNSLMKTAVDPPMELNLFNNNIYVTNNGSNIIISNATNTSVGEVPFESEFNPSDNKMPIMNRADWNSILDPKIDSAIDGNIGISTDGEGIDTIIESAIDGDGEKLDNGSSTTSDSITFTFSAKLNGEPLEEDVVFKCVLDNNSSFCDSPKTYSDLEIRNEPYIFRVNAFTLLSNGTINQTDTTPANFTWTIEGDDDNGSSGGGNDDDDDNGSSGGGNDDDDDNGSSGGGNDDDDDDNGSSGGGNDDDDDDNGSSGGGNDDDDDDNGSSGGGNDDDDDDNGSSGGGNDDDDDNGSSGGGNDDDDDDNGSSGGGNDDDDDDNGSSGGRGDDGKSSKKKNPTKKDRPWDNNNSKIRNEAAGNETDTSVIPSPGGNETDTAVIPPPGGKESGTSVIPPPGGKESGTSVIPPPTKPQTFNQTNAAAELLNKNWYFVISP